MKKNTVKIGLGAIGVGIIGYGLYSMKKDTEKLFNAPGSFLDGLFGPDGILGGSGLPGTETEPVNSGNTTKKFLDDTLEYITKPEERVKAKNAEIYAENPDQTTRTQYGTAGPLSGFTDLVTKGPIGILGNVIADIGSSINPMPDDLKATQTKYASGNFGVEDIAGQDSLYRKLFIKESSPSGSSKTGSLPIVPASSIKSDDTILDVKKSLDLNIPMTGASPVTKYTEKASNSSSSYTDSTGRVYTPTSVIKAKW